MTDPDGTPSKPAVVEFATDDLAPAVALVAQLRQAHAGWIDITPAGVDVTPPPSLWARINSRTSTTPRITWTAPHLARSRVAPAELGIEHGAAQRALPFLADRGHPLPAGWVRTQDHPYRGLVVVPAADAPAAEVVGWAVVALAHLCEPDRPERWQARVHTGL